MELATAIYALHPKTVFRISRAERTESRNVFVRIRDDGITGYGEAVKHGEAVGLGCAMAFRFSARLGLCSGQDAVRAELATAIPPPPRPPTIN